MPKTDAHQSSAVGEDLDFYWNSQVVPIGEPKEERRRKQKRKAKGEGPRYHNRTIAGRDLPHMEVRGGCAALNGAENGSEGFKGRVGFFFSLEGSRVFLTKAPYFKLT
jgi:hypothetical protein